MKVEITQDKLVDLLLHAATREDITLLRQETKEDINKLGNQISVLRQETKEDNNKLSNQIATYEPRIDRQFLKIGDRYSWTIGVIIGTGATIIGVVTTLVGFIIKMH